MKLVENKVKGNLEILTYVFKDGKINYENLQKLVNAVGKEHLVLDLSCKKIGEEYRIVTDRWQNITDETVTLTLMNELAKYCSEFLIHAVDVEGKVNGIEAGLVELLGDWKGLPITYAGGVHSYEDLDLLKELGRNWVNVTIGSALDLFGGKLEWKEVAKRLK